jgi:predicted enzyme related to lactoylglutathione lyase
MRDTTWNPNARNRAVKEAELLRGVAVVWMPVQNIERAKGFYRDTLGLKITNEDGEWAEVNADGLTIGLNGREPSGVESTGSPVVTFRPKGSLEQTVGDLKEQGVEVPAETPTIPGDASRRSRTARATTCSSTSRRATKSLAWGHRAVGSRPSARATRGMRLPFLFRVSPRISIPSEHMGPKIHNTSGCAFMPYYPEAARS